VTRITVGEVSLEVEDRGSGPPVLLLHGWPDAGRLWRHQVDALGAAGFRTVVPDLRGFGESDRPERIEDYAITCRVADMVAVLDGLGIDRADVVGHDWGARLAWSLGAFVPKRVERLVVMSVGDPNTLHNQSIEQREKSWYQLFSVRRCGRGAADARRLEAVSRVVEGKPPQRFRRTTSLPPKVIA
jgi:pimeloyl-ACP methyl ester carboxylesterase